MQFLAEYGLFLAKLVSFAVIILFLLSGIALIMGKAKGKTKDELKIKNINEKYREMREKIIAATLSKEELKKFYKQEKATKKAEQNAKKLAQKSQNKSAITKKVYVLDFHGDIRASAISNLRQEITALLTVLTPKDEIVLRLESGGGMVHAYGLAASQLKRIREKGIPLTIAVDKVAASGGYMMACVANKIIAAPFAIVGSIGVIAQVPNFNKVLKKHDIDFEQIMAGEYKRTLSLFGENTDSGREKFRQEIEETHTLFKAFIAENRPGLDMAKIATGEHWYGSQAMELKLIDQLITSDDYLLSTSKKADIYEVKYTIKKSLSERLSASAHIALKKLWLSWQTQPSNHLLY